MATTAGTTVTTVLRSRDLTWAIGGWLFFVAENAILSENRTFLIDWLGGDDDAYHAAYGTCSTMATASIAYSYRKLRRGLPQSSVLPLSGVRLGMAGSVMSLGLILASQTFPKLQVPVEFASSSSETDPSLSSTTEPAAADNDDTKAAAAAAAWKLKVRCPFDFADKTRTEDNGNGTTTVVGLERVSRHPGLWAFGLTAAGNAALQPTPALALWFLGPALVAAVGGAHTDSRYRRGLGGTMTAEYDWQTSNVPFVAMLSGKQGCRALQTWLTEEVKPWNAAIATGVACLWVASRGRSSSSAARARVATVQGIGKVAPA